MTYNAYKLINDIPSSGDGARLIKRTVNGLISLKSIKGTSGISILDDGSSITISGSNTTSIVSDGTGGSLSLTNGIISDIIHIKGIKAGLNVSLVDNGTDITIAQDIAEGSLTPNKFEQIPALSFIGNDIASPNVPKAISNATAKTMLNLSGTNTGDQEISDATLVLSDITTNNVTITKHGFVPKGTNVGRFLRDDGTWALLPDGTTGNPNAIVPATSLTFSSNITVDCSVNSKFYLTLTGNTTITFINAVVGQTILLMLSQDGTGGRTITWASDVRFGTDITSTDFSLGANKTDYCSVIFNSASNKYDVISLIRGF